METNSSGGKRVRTRRRSSKPRLPRRLVWLTIALLVLIAGLLMAMWQIGRSGVTPRALSPYVVKRSSDHNSLIVSAGQWAGQTLMALDRGTGIALPDPLRKPLPDIPAPLGVRAIAVGSVQALRAALEDAAPGDVITIAPGSYLIDSGALDITRAGAEGLPVVVRAARSGTVNLLMGIGEGFKVMAPYWQFENLSLTGVCKRHEFCEHAFHIVGGAHHFAARNNTVVDFNSHFKINAENGRFPDHGEISGNTITNRSARETNSSVTLVDLVAANHWRIRGNVITDFIKAGGDRISYGGFAKGAGSDNVFERNIVVCEHRLRAVGQRVGLSLGGGGTGKPYCRDGRCITEQSESVLQANLIASCSDDGIYINSAARSKVLHNTVLDTGGVVVRYPESSAELEGNLVDGTIRSRNGGVLRLGDNVDTSMVSLYLGRHPVRALFGMPALSWRDAAPRSRPADSQPDLCGTVRPQAPAYGAFEDFSACRP